MSEKCNADLKQMFNLLDTLFIGKEQNDVIICLNHRVVVGNNDLFTADNRAYCGTTRQLDFINHPPHHP